MTFPMSFKSFDPPSPRAMAFSAPPSVVEILAAAAEYLKVGGRLLYATCTVLKAENEQVVEDFLSRHPHFATVPFSVGEHTAENGMLTLLPHIHGTDGFFVALLEKKS